MRKVVSAEYKEISDALITVNATLKGIENHLSDLNGKTSSHSNCIESLNKWVAVHDGVEKRFKEMEDKRGLTIFQRTKNNIAIIGIVVLVLFELIQLIL